MQVYFNVAREPSAEVRMIRDFVLLEFISEYFSVLIKLRPFSILRRLLILSKRQCCGQEN